MPDWDSIIKYAKDIGVLLGLFVGLFALRNHWKTIFRPHQKKLEDQEFSAVEALLKAIRNHNFLFIYNSKDNTIDSLILKDLLHPIAEPSASPFLPERINKACTDFVVSIFKSTNYPLIIYIREGKVDEADKITITNKKDIFNSHKSLHYELAKHLNLSGLTFNFELNE